MHRRQRLATGAGGERGVPVAPMALAGGFHLLGIWLWGWHPELGASSAGGRLGGGELRAVGQGPAREAPLKEQPRAGEMNNVIIGKLNLSCSFLFLS